MWAFICKSSQFSVSKQTGHLGSGAGARIFEFEVEVAAVALAVFVSLVEVEVESGFSFGGEISSDSSFSLFSLYFIGLSSSERFKRLLCLNCRTA
jgi:hypothetical protein